ncbi:hypothetical protein IAU60_003495 [Kwoniella sp. DSM 27419]
MSTHELVPLFPSATHPALPISVQILSTLRHLTAPGKGNDLKPEERAALVGVSALLGCEKIQSKDLPLSSAQKASSVSPAHFRSTLSRCRKLLESLPSSPGEPSVSPSKRSPAKRGAGRGEETEVPPAVGAGTEAGPSSPTKGGTAVEDVLNPLSTPKKKYKFSSGVDIFSLVRTPRTPRHHEPVTASPLRQSVTRQPSTKYAKGDLTTRLAGEPRRVAEGNPGGLSQDDDQGRGRDELEREVEQEQGEEQDAGTGPGTPTKKVKYAQPVGVDLEHPPASIPAPTRKRKQESASAFFALRPGLSGGPAATVSGLDPKARGTGVDAMREDEWMHRLPRERRTRQPREKKPSQVRKVDWTYTEQVWSAGPAADLDKVWSELSMWLEQNGLPPAEGTEVRGHDLSEIILSAASAPTQEKGMEVD